MWMDGQSISDLCLKGSMLESLDCCVGGGASICRLRKGKWGYRYLNFETRENRGGLFIFLCRVWGRPNSRMPNP